MNVLVWLRREGPTVWAPIHRKRRGGNFSAEVFPSEQFVAGSAAPCETSSAFLKHVATPRTRSP